MSLVMKRKFPVLTGDEARKWDIFSIEQAGVDSRLLMAWAGQAAAIHIKRKIPESKIIHLLAGSGNNGGDGFVVLWHLLTFVENLKVHIWLVAEPSTEDASYFYQLLKMNLNIEFHYLKDFISVSGLHLANSLVIDALFGTGLNRSIEGEIAAAMKHAETALTRIAIDIPSGLPVDGDEIKGGVFKADLTITFGAYKIAHLIEPGILYCGKVVCCPIGFAPFKHASRRLIKKYKWKKLRQADGHKYRSGVLHILGGSDGMEGAALLSATAFLRSGGGLVKLYSTSQDIKKILKSRPEIMVRSEKNSDQIYKHFFSDISPQKNPLVLIGVGLTEVIPVDFWQKLFQIEGLKLVLDGSVLRHLHSHMELFRNRVNSDVILTPHKSEAESLLNDKIINIRNSALKISGDYQADVYIKGPGGIITAYDSEKKEFKKEIFPVSKVFALATGGSGDVLSGLIAREMLVRKNSSKALEAALYFYLKTARKIVRKSDSDYLLPSDISQFIH